MSLYPDITLPCLCGPLAGQERTVSAGILRMYDAKTHTGYEVRPFVWGTALVYECATHETVRAAAQLYEERHVKTPNASAPDVPKAVLDAVDSVAALYELNDLDTKAIVLRAWLKENGR